MMEVFKQKCYHFLGLALVSLASFLLRTRTLYLSKSVRFCLRCCLAKALPSELSANFLATPSLLMMALTFPERAPLPTLRTCLVSWSLRMGMTWRWMPSPSTRTRLSLRISTIVANLPSRGPQLMRATRPIYTNLEQPILCGRQQQYQNNQIYLAEAHYPFHHKLLAMTSICKKLQPDSQFLSKLQQKQTVTSFTNESIAPNDVFVGSFFRSFQNVFVCTFFANCLLFVCGAYFVLKDLIEVQSQITSLILKYNTMSLDRTVKWIDKTQGRDKFCKAIQYACRFLKHRFETSGNKDAAKKFESLFTNMRDARKLFRLLKSVNEAKKIKDLLASDMTIDNILNIIVRGFFLLYWFFDNLNILSKIKILNQDPKKMAKIGSTFWLIALITNLILLFKNLSSNLKKCSQLKRLSYSLSSEEGKEKKKQYHSQLTKRTQIVINIAKVLGDVIPAGQGSDVFPNLLGFTANDSACGLGGLVSALITSYQLYQ